MSEQQFDIIFRGDIVLGRQLMDVKATLQQLFKVDAAKVDALFTGKPVPLKRGLDRASAQKYKDALLKAGAQVELVAVGDITLTAAPVSPPSANQTMSLAQRLQAQADAAAQAEQVKAQQIEIRLAQQALASANESGTNAWSLAPVGAELLRATEKHSIEPVVVDISGISLRAGVGNILDASEQPSAPLPSVIAPNFQVAEVGANLMQVDEHMILPIPEIELEDWTLAEAGADLIAESEKVISPVAVVHIPDVSLAPAGADLGQLKPQVKAVLPDISGLSLVN